MYDRVEEQRPIHMRDPLFAAVFRNVDKIRDILFGGQMRDYEQRFARVEEETAKELNRLRNICSKGWPVIPPFEAWSVCWVWVRLKEMKRSPSFFIP